MKVDIRNRLGQKPFELSHNSHIATLLQNAINVSHQSDVTSDWDDEQSQCSSISSSTTSLNHEVFRGCFSTGLNHAVDSVSFPQKTCNDKIVAAIKNNDTKLAYHFLGIELTDESSQIVCHPLCDCHKCKHITEFLSHKSSNTIQSMRSYDGNINECSTDGLTPLHAAVQTENIELVEHILKLGGKVNVCTKLSNQTAIHLAVVANSVDILNILLNHLGPIENENNLDIQDSNGDTALHLAVRHGNEYAVDALLKHEPNIHIRNSDQKTVAEIATSLLNLKIMQRLEIAQSNDLRDTKIK